ncbi:MAG: PilX N-terminal domain-containing pilus assembly protein [Thermoanaerobaculia bacterium]|nr:PilX N-terminal domain-containing pilus assembly protein [Thermoanaerobaculia bacterium]
MQRTNTLKQFTSRIRRSAPPSRPRCSAERGSATVIALLVLFLISLLGLGLAMVTSTESMIAANERLSTQSFYAADSGLDLAAVRVILADDTSPLLVQVNGIIPNRATRTEFLLETVDPLIDMPCNLCSISVGSGYESDDYGRRVFSLESEGRRASINNDTDARLFLDEDDPEGNYFAARRSVNAFLDIQPLTRSGEVYREMERRSMLTN